MLLPPPPPLQLLLPAALLELLLGRPPPLPLPQLPPALLSLQQPLCSDAPAQLWLQPLLLLHRSLINRKHSAIANGSAYTIFIASMCCD